MIMEFGIEIPSGKAFDAVALGLNAIDYLIVVPHFPEFNTKIPLISHTLAPGGQCATAMVTLARLGLRTRYIGSVGSDDLGRIQIDFIVCSGTFTERMTGEPDLRAGLKKLAQSSGSPFVAATIGRDGVLAYFQGKYIHSPAFKVDCRDTTGAGDAFHGGFIYGLLAGFSVGETLRFANAVAGLNCRAVGARTGLPSLNDVNSL